MWGIFILPESFEELLGKMDFVKRKSHKVSQHA